MSYDEEDIVVEDEDATGDQCDTRTSPLLPEETNLLVGREHISDRTGNQEDCKINS